MITANIPREVTFELPEGRYRARISNLKPFMKQAGAGPQDWLRILFEVHVPGLSERADTMAGRSFKLNLNPGSEFRNWITGLLGKEFFKLRSGQEVSFDSLLGTECEVELEHYYGAGYPKPMVVVVGVYPANPIRQSMKGVQATQD